MSSGLNTVYPVETSSGPSSSCCIDLDAIRRISLRAPMLGDPLSLQAATFAARLDSVLEHAPLHRVLVVAHALAEIARADEGAAAIFKAAGLARQIRAEVEARKAGSMGEQSAAIVQHTRLLPAQEGAIHG